MAELKNLGEAGRKALVEAWSGYIPKYGDEHFQTSATGQMMVNGQNGSHVASVGHQLMDEEEDER